MRSGGEGQKSHDGGVIWSPSDTRPWFHRQLAVAQLGNLRPAPPLREAGTSWGSPCNSTDRSHRGQHRHNGEHGEACVSETMLPTKKTKVLRALIQSEGREAVSQGVEEIHGMTCLEGSQMWCENSEESSRKQRVCRNPGGPAPTTTESARRERTPHRCTRVRHSRLAVATQRRGLFVNTPSTPRSPMSRI